MRQLSQSLQPVFIGLVALMVLSSVGVAANRADFDAAWAKADAARQEAADLGHEWRDTALFLEQAKSLAAEGKMDDAMRLVEHAELEGRQAAIQAREQKTLWRDAMPQ